MRWVLHRLRLTNEFLVPYPALVPVCGAMIGVLVVSLSIFGRASRWTTWGTGLILFTVALIVLGRRWRTLCAATATGMALSLIHLLGPWSTYHQHLPGDESHVELVATVTDSRLLRHPELEWLQPRRNIEIAIHQLRLSPGDTWKACRGKTVIHKPAEELRYGQRIALNGALQLPWRNTLDHQFDYTNYLRGRGIRHIICYQTIEIIAPAPQGWRRLPALFLAVRERVLLQLLAHVTDQDDRSILAAMTLGLRGGLTPEQKDMYLCAGELHLFAISGLHVGICFTLALLVLTLCRVPFHTRFFVAPAILLVYVLATGAAPSACRAWLMLAIWSVGRGLKLPVKPVNSVLAAGLILLLFRPFSLYQAGFQYSFLLVLCLLVGWRWGRHLCSSLLEQHRWVPFRAQRHTIGSRLFARAMQASAAMLIFWFGAVGLTAWYNQLFLPLSFFSNLSAGILAWLIFLGSVIKVALGFVFAPLGWDWPSQASAWCLRLVIWPLRSWAGFTASLDAVIGIAKPRLILVVAYYLAVAAVALCRRNLKHFTGRVCILLAVAVLLLGGRQWTRPGFQIHALHPAESSAPVIVVRSQDNRVTLIGTGPKYFDYRLRQWLQGEGIRRIDCICLLNQERMQSGAAVDLITNTRADTVAAFAEPGSRRLQALTRACEESRTRIRVATGATIEQPGITIRRKAPSVWRIRCKDRGAKYVLDLTVDAMGTTTLRYANSRGAARTYAFPYTDVDHCYQLRQGAEPQREVARPEREW